MTSLGAALLAAGWLGILTSISPCPLATNIAAVSYLARRLHSRRLAVLGAAAYSLGRALVYVVIGMVLSLGAASAPRLSAILQQNVGPFAGPVLIVVALVLLGWISLPVDFRLGGQAAAERLSSFGVLGEFLLGALFALSFCPVSAALFFGALVPLALASTAPFLPLAAYGIGTALPVVVLSTSIAFGFSSSSRMLAAVQRWDDPLQKGTAVVVLAAGVYLTLSLSIGLF